jgi:hypothetical protein
MATETGVLQALWAEVRPAIEARDPALCRPLSKLVNRGKSAEALQRFREALDLPPNRELEVLRRIAAMLGSEGLIAHHAQPLEVRSLVWEEVLKKQRPVLMNCRVFFDEPFPDRLWLQRRGRWILYRWDGARMGGTCLEEVRAKVAEDRNFAKALLVEVSVCGKPFVNPKLPPIAARPGS